MHGQARRDGSWLGWASHGWAWLGWGGWQPPGFEAPAPTQDSAWRDWPWLALAVLGWSRPGKAWEHPGDQQTSECESLTLTQRGWSYGLALSYTRLDGDGAAVQPAEPAALNGWVGALITRTLSCFTLRCHGQDS